MDNITKIFVFTISLFNLACTQVEFAPIPQSEAESLAEAGITRIQSRIEVKEIPKIDVLLVIDNSGSMREEQVELARKIGGLINRIQHLDWQLSVLTTDPRTSLVGRAIPYDSPVILSKNSSTSAEAQLILSELIKVGLDGSGDERGIASMMAHLRRDLNQAVPSFHRADSTLVTILLSDEDECSDGQCVATSADSNPALVQVAIQDLFAAKFGQAKNFRFHSLIEIPGDSSCLTGYNPGNTYQQLSLLTNGLVGSICANDFAPVLAAIGNDSVQLVNQIELSCANPQVQVLHEGTQLPIEQNYVVNGALLIFEQPLPAGFYKMIQDCLL